MYSAHEDPQSTATHRRERLWIDRNFAAFWAGQSISALGTSVSNFALPLVGVLTLRLTPIEVGTLASVSYLPSVLFGPFIGPVVDRLDRRNLLIATDLARAGLTAAIPAALALGRLSYGLLLVVGMAMSALSLLFSVAHQTVLPSVVPSALLEGANGKLESTESFADVGGPGLAGWISGAGGPVLALALDASSYLASAVFLSRVRLQREDEQPAVDAADDHSLSIWTDMKGGFRLLWNDSVLRTVASSYSIIAFFAQMQVAVYILYLVRSREIQLGTLGLVFTLSGVVGFIAALVSSGLAMRFGVGRLVVLGQLVMIAGGVFLAAVSGNTLQMAILILLSESCWAIGLSFYGVGSRTLFQRRTADAVRGKVIGAAAAVRGLLVCLSYLVGGAIAQVSGPRVTLILAAAGMVLISPLVMRRKVWIFGDERRRIA